MSNAQVTVEMSLVPFPVDVKQFSLPCVLRTSCPACGAAYERHFDDHSLSYPMANVPFDLTLVCDAEVPDFEVHAETTAVKYCNHEWKVRLHLSIQLLIVTPVEL